MRLYQFPVKIRVIDIGGITKACSMRAVSAHGKLMEIDQIGFYLVAPKDSRCSKSEIRRHLTNAFDGFVVVRAENIHQAMAKLGEHPGVRGLGGERPDKKAVVFDSSGWRQVKEMPDCDLQSAFEGDCFYIDEQGWARCRYTEGLPENKEMGYHHCLLQEADEAPTGCGLEEWLSERIGKETELRIVPAIHYAALPG